MKNSIYSKLWLVSSVVRPVFFRHKEVHQVVAGSLLPFKSVVFIFICKLKLLILHHGINELESLEI